MKLKVLFLSIIVILVVAAIGMYWVWEKGEGRTPLPIVNNEPSVVPPGENTIPFTTIDKKFNTDEFETDKETGWKIFRFDGYPLSFLFPPELGEGNLMISRRRSDEKISYSHILLKGSNYTLTFYMPPPEQGSEGAEEFDRMEIILGDKRFIIHLLEYSSEILAWSSYDEENDLLNITNVIHPNVGGLEVRLICITSACSPSKSRSILKQIVSSIRLASDPR